MKRTASEDGAHEHAISLWPNAWILHLSSECIKGCSLAPTLHTANGKDPTLLPRSLRREGIVWPGTHQIPSTNGIQNAPGTADMPSTAGHWTKAYSCSLQSCRPHGPLTVVLQYLYLYRRNAYLPRSLMLAHHLVQVTWPERVGRCRARVRKQSNERDSEVRVSPHQSVFQPHLDTIDTYHLLEHSRFRRISGSVQPSATLPRVLPRNLNTRKSEKQSAWLVPYIIASAT